MKTYVKIDEVPRFSLDVEQAIIHVNSISILQATPSVIKLSADCRAKYPVCAGCGHDVIYLNAGKYTYGHNRRFKKYTRIKIEGIPDDNWVMIDPVAGRYTVTWYYVRNPEPDFKRKVLDKFQWTDDD